jgi:hypothetical protein
MGQTKTRLSFMLPNPTSPCGRAGLHCDQQPVYGYVSTLRRWWNCSRRSGAQLLAREGVDRPVLYSAALCTTTEQHSRSRLSDEQDHHGLQPSYAGPDAFFVQPAVRFELLRRPIHCAQ